MIKVPEAILDRIRRSAFKVMDTRPPDEVIGGRENPYMRRWKAAKHRYIHEFLRSDDDRALHDHPWRSVSLLLWNDMAEVYAQNGSNPSRIEQQSRRILRQGQIVYRPAGFSHRVDLFNGPAITLFFIGSKVRDWGFHCEAGWRHWREFDVKGCGD